MTSTDEDPGLVYLAAILVAIVVLYFLTKPLLHWPKRRRR